MRFKITQLQLNDKLVLLSISVTILIAVIGWVFFQRDDKIQTTHEVSPNKIENNVNTDGGDVHGGIGNLH